MQFIPNRPPKHVITSTYYMIKYDLLHINTFLANKDLIDYSKQTTLQKIQRMIMIDSNNSLPRSQFSIQETSTRQCGRFIR